MYFTNIQRFIFPSHLKAQNKDSNLGEKMFFFQSSARIWHSVLCHVIIRVFPTSGGSDKIFMMGSLLIKTNIHLLIKFLTRKINTDSDYLR